MKKALRFSFPLALGFICLVGFLTLTTSSADARPTILPGSCPAVTCPAILTGYTHTGFCDHYYHPLCPPLDCERWQNDSNGQYCYRNCAAV